MIGNLRFHGNALASLEIPVTREARRVVHVKADVVTEVVREQGLHSL